MSVVFLILKILGIILLVILGLLILLVLSVLFLPFRYRFRGTIHEDLKGRFVINWLFHLISFQCDIVNLKPEIRLRIFGIPKRFQAEVEAEAPENKKKKRTKKKKQKNLQNDLDNGKKSKKNVPKEDMAEDSQVKESDDTVKTLEGPTKEDEPTSQSAYQRLKQKIMHIFHKIISVPYWILAKLKDVKGFFLNIKNIIMDETNKNTLIFLIQEARIILRHISPRNVKVDITFGMGDPAVTGQILGICSTLPFFYRYNCDIRPDFQAESFYINGSFDIKGYVRGLHLLTMGIRIIRNKDIRIVIKNYRK